MMIGLHGVVVGLLGSWVDPSVGFAEYLPGDGPAALEGAMTSSRVPRLEISIEPQPNIAMVRSERVAMMVSGFAVAPEGVSGPLRITVEPTIDDAGLIPGWVLTRNPHVIEVIPSIEGYEQWITVDIGGATYDYRVSVVAMRDGFPVGSVGEPTRCECNSEKLLELVDARIVAAAESLRTTVPVVEEHGQADPGQTSEPRSNGAEESDRPRRLGTMGYVGIGAGILGAGLLAVGIPLIQRPGELRGEPGNLSSYETRPPGIGFATGGGIALAGGIALIVVDLLRQRKSAVAVLPTFGPRHVGLSLARNF